MRIRQVAVCMALLMLAGCKGSNDVDNAASQQNATENIEAAATGEYNKGNDMTASDNQNNETRLRIYGPVKLESDTQLSIDNQSDVSSKGEIILNISPEMTYVIDASTGYPMQLSELHDKDIIYAYIGDVMTLSLPPQTTPLMVLANVLQDEPAPAYAVIKSVQNEKNDVLKLKLSDGSEVTVGPQTKIEPYRTRNIVRKEDLTEGRNILVWADASGNASRIILFAE